MEEKTWHTLKYTKDEIDNGTLQQYPTNWRFQREKKSKWKTNGMTLWINITKQNKAVKIKNG